MARKEFYKELEIRERELVEELEAIRKLRNGISNVNSNVSHSTSTVPNNNDGRGLPKGDLSWEEYWLFLLKENGGSCKTGELAKVGIKANPTLDKELIVRSARSKLSALAKKGAINVKVNRNKKIGNTYSAK